MAIAMALAMVIIQIHEVESLSWYGDIQQNMKDCKITNSETMNTWKRQIRYPQTMNLRLLCLAFSSSQPSFIYSLSSVQNPCRIFCWLSPSATSSFHSNFITAAAFPFSCKFAVLSTTIYPPSAVTADLKLRKCWANIPFCPLVSSFKFWCSA